MITKPSYKPTDADRNTVRIMAACGVTHEDISKCLGTKGIAPKTLRKHFARELETAYLMANAQAGAKLFEAVNKGEAWAVCFWLKCRARWQEVVRYEHTGADSGPVTINISGDSDPKVLLRSRIAGLAARLNPEPSVEQPVNGTERTP